MGISLITLPLWILKTHTTNSGMFALLDLHLPQVLGQHFSSFNEVTKVLWDWSNYEKFNYCVSKWYLCYQLIFINIINLIPRDVFSPTTRVQWGWPKKKRICLNKAGVHARIQQVAGSLLFIHNYTSHYCSTCG